MEQDFQDLISTLSLPPQHTEYHIGTTEGSKWESKCIREILPALLKYVKQDDISVEDAALILQAIFKAYEHPEVGGSSDYKKLVGEIIERSINIVGEDALSLLCKVVSVNRSIRLDWPKLVNILITREYKEATPYIVVGLINRYTHETFKNLIREEEVNSAIEAIHVLGLNDKDKVIGMLISSRDDLLKKKVIIALGCYGNNDSAKLLKKRLGSVVSKPEKDHFTRQLIESAIKEINAREQP